MDICKYCLKKRFEILYPVQDYMSKKTFSLKRCLGCTLVQTMPRLTTKQLKKYYIGYREMSGKRLWQPAENILNYWHLKRVDKIKKYKSVGRILDIGCGRGVELEALQKQGWKSYGTEFNQSLKQTLKNKKIEIFIGDFWSANYNKNYFDVISLWHSLEHLDNIKKVFNEVRKILKKNGILIFAIPNFNSLEQGLFGQDWFHLDVPRHIMHFSDKFITKLLAKNNFEIIAKNYIAPEYDFYSFSQSALNKIFKKQNLLYRVLNKDLSLKKIEVLLLVIQLPIGLLIVVFSLFFIPLGWILKKGGTVEIISQKK